MRPALRALSATGERTQSWRAEPQWGGGKKSCKDCLALGHLVTWNTWPCICRAPSLCKGEERCEFGRKSSPYRTQPTRTHRGPQVEHRGPQITHWGAHTAAPLLLWPHPLCCVPVLTPSAALTPSCWLHLPPPPRGGCRASSSIQLPPQASGSALLLTAANNVPWPHKVRFSSKQ